MRFETGDPLHLPPLPLYESALLSSLAFFRQQERTTQALNCLAMYLRQSEARVLGEIRFYAKLVNLESDELLMLIHQHPDQAEALLKNHLKQRLNLPE
ncbi:hypothetical protein HJG54_16000 [Leptolyngbya sp. NK1-12]|uniref:Uncharacterized protein n=1 Tax=Leptolyngbya sp. NK1-12 TaxID=2547451 RepID=A0AA96WFG2_9CYAN|nr:hypothetical protein [Leptolyngbya sp. NK1-12]MBF2045972.1 hypothetical protein [Elainella sp. C42_A2020_010]RNJ68311.1 MAG: hypothetical protein EDM05_14410 [Leptolyngbya sp. IPPAS B-1204]WNZ24208.1 hypothetical protein HJG54_16000 [Leptolyngbya sp. NK1-12]